MTPINWAGQKVTRRTLGRIVGAAAATAVFAPLLAACAPAATPTSAPAKPPEPAKPPATEPTKPAAAAPVAPTKPAAEPAKPPATEPTKPAAPAAAPPVAKEQARITFLSRAVEFIKAHHDEMTKQFVAKNPNVVVENQYTPAGEYSQKLQILAASGTMPDTLWTASILDFGPMLSKGLLADLNPLAKAATFDLSVLFKQAIEAETVGGKLYGLPWLVHPSRQLFYYSKPLFDEAGVKYPDDSWTWETLAEASVKLTKGPPEKRTQFGFRPETFFFAIATFIRSAGADYMTADGKRVTLDDPKSIQAIQYLADLFNKHKSSPVPAQVVGGSPQMMGAKTLASFNGNYTNGGQIRNFAADLPWGSSWLAKGPSGKTVGLFEFDPLSVTAKTKFPDAAFQYIASYMSVDAGLDMFKRGIPPGGRIETWESAELMKDPHHALGLKILRETPAVVMPANWRMVEFYETVDRSLEALWIGRETDASKVIKSFTSDVQAILDKPPA